ncbi:MAG: ATP-binding cassette domain-containing protein [Methylococcales bacterium]|nr:ATP-binding cassette domain-containing protein [Methylococcales bacterium]
MNDHNNQAYQLNQIDYFYKKNSGFNLTLPTLNIPAQKITALMGDNGSGKSTLLKLLGLLERPKQGSLKFFNTPVTLKQHTYFRRQIGFLAQKPYLFRGSVNDNLRLILKIHQIPNNQHRAKITTILEQLTLDNLQEHPAKMLSGGQLQKVALARALITQPKVLLMDEPFSYLDQTSSQLLEQFILNYVINTQNTLIFSTHNRLQGLAIADNMISLAKGRQIESPLVNLFKGIFEAGYFKTAHLTILATKSFDSSTHISIDPRDIVLSKNRLNSSMQNQYQGRVIAITKENELVRVSVNAGDIFQVMITQEALTGLDLRLTALIWMSFKANAVVIV